MAARKPDPVAVERALKAAQDRKRRQQMGKPLRLSDANLDAASVVSDVDAAAAEVAWDRDCSPEFRGLLAATPRELT